VVNFVKKTAGISYALNQYAEDGYCNPDTVTTSHQK